MRNSAFIIICALAAALLGAHASSMILTQSTDPSKCVFNLNKGYYQETAIDALKDQINYYTGQLSDCQNVEIDLRQNYLNDKNLELVSLGLEDTLSKFENIKMLHINLSNNKFAGTNSLHQLFEYILKSFSPKVTSIELMFCFEGNPLQQDPVNSFFKSLAVKPTTLQIKALHLNVANAGLTDSNSDQFADAFSDFPPALSGTVFNFDYHGNTYGHTKSSKIISSMLMRQRTGSPRSMPDRLELMSESSSTTVSEMEKLITSARSQSQTCLTAYVAIDRKDPNFSVSALRKIKQDIFKLNQEDATKECFKFVIEY